MSASRYLLPLTAIAVVAAAPVAAQKIGGLGFQLIKSVKDNDMSAFYQITRESGGQLNSAVLDYESDGETAMTVAVRDNRPSFVNDLMYFGASPNKPGVQGETPLTLAILLRNGPIVDLLFKGRAQVDAPNRRGETPLIKAVQIRDLGLVQLLLQKGASPDKADFTGQSARGYAAADTRNPAIAKVLAAAPKVQTRSVAGPKLN